MSNDEQLQRGVEEGDEFSGDNLDAKAYHQVFASLKKEPERYLPLNFADKLIVRLQEEQRKTASKDFYWLVAGVFLLTIALIVAVILTGFKPGLGFLKGMSSYAGLFVFGGAFILFLNRLDKKLLPKTE